MTVNELILKNKHEVRRDSNLMSLYLQYFQEAFNKLPNCAGCSFASDWQKLVSFHSKTQSQKSMKPLSKTISIKKIQGKILSYKKDGKTFRLYDNILNDDFISEYLKNGSEKEVAERKKMFNFPVEINKSFEEIAEDNLSKKGSVDFAKESVVAEKIIEKSKILRKTKK